MTALEQEAGGNLEPPRIEVLPRLSEGRVVELRVDVIAVLPVEDVEDIQADLNGIPGHQIEVLRVVQIDLPVGWVSPRAGRFRIAVGVARARRQVLVGLEALNLPRLPRLRDEEEPRAAVPGEHVGAVDLDQVRTIPPQIAVLEVPELASRPVPDVGRADEGIHVVDGTS